MNLLVLKKIHEEVLTKPEIFQKISLSATHKQLSQLNFREESILGKYKNSEKRKDQFFTSMKLGSKPWVDCSLTSRIQAFLDGRTTGLCNPSGKGRRLIVLHIGSDYGFVDNSLLLFEGRKTTDYHEEMNAQRFTTWFAEILGYLPSIYLMIVDDVRKYPLHQKGNRT
ncbi:hypothetical protein NQ317_017841 [Molorchus minor]|uniref:Transposase n=1 Tax=Molorchus minor TaxID=1323400 RepID=A0ABQ9K2C0_9CUCU|nr:hypothetical protein NQ317_017841 [Molorchus minor]